MSPARTLKTMGAAVFAFMLLIVIFTPGAWAKTKYKTLHRFSGHDGLDGANPVAGLIFDPAGNLFGTTSQGGANRYYGTVFELVPKSDGSWKEEVLHSFNGSDGLSPAGGLVLDSAGNLYGTTSSQGPNGWGTVFELTQNRNGGWTETVLYSFCSISNCQDGAQPLASLVFDQQGNLYGTTQNGGSGSACSTSGYPCGTVFKLTHKADGSWTETVLHSFCSKKGCSDGESPQFGGVVFDQAGNLYGTALYGGNCDISGGCGVVFRLTPHADGEWTESVLYNFCQLGGCADGLFPIGGLIFDQGGNLYGTAETGGTYENGVVFQLTPRSDGRWKEKVLHNFTGADGAAPYAGLVFDHAGNLYGTTFEGGPGHYGVVFKLAPDLKGRWQETALHSFYDRPGAIPNSGVVFDAAGNFYGTTNGDNNTTFGSVFEIMP